MISNQYKAIIAAHLGDVHYGAFDSKLLTKELKLEFMRRIKKLPRLDVLVIEGDFYNHELSLNSNHVYYSFKFWDKLFPILRKKQCKKIRIIKGTKSHDHDQLNNLMFPDDFDVKIINNVETEELFPNFKVLYLPEEYIKNPEEYYKEYFNPKEKYDMIVGHGMFEEESFNNYNSEIQMEAAPIYNSKALCSICDGPIVFGHIHNGVIIRNQIFYTGSFSRWCHGEENPKGFLISIHDLENKKYLVIPCTNNCARKFITRNLTPIIERYNAEEIIEMVEAYVAKRNIHSYKMIVNESSDAKFMGKVAVLQNYFIKNKYIELNLKNLNIQDDNEEDEDQMNVSRYAYLFDGGVEKEDKISRFIKDRFNYDLTPERINTLLTCDILKLIDEMANEDD